MNNSGEMALAAAPKELGVRYEAPERIPDRYALAANYPNPFNPATSIAYDLPEQTHVTLRVLDVLGREVALLVDEVQDKGAKQATWDASRAPSGIYFYQLVAGSFNQTRKMALIR